MPNQEARYGRIGRRAGRSVTGREGDQAVSDRTGRCATRAVAEVLCKESAIVLHSASSTAIAVGHCAVHHIKAVLTLIQTQLEAESRVRVVIVDPVLDIEDAVGGGATGRGEDTATRATAGATC